MKTLTQWWTPTGRPAVVHYPQESCRPLRSSPTAFTAAVCGVGVERRHFIEDAARVTCRECQAYFARRATP